MITPNLRHRTRQPYLHRPPLWLLALLLLPSLMACSQPQAPYTPAQQKLRDDIGEMLLIGFRGTRLTDTCHIVRDIRDYHIGGVILFEYDAPSGRHQRNISSPEQLQHLCHQLQSFGNGRLLIGIDQEGGKVNRLKEKYGFPHTASAQYMAAKGLDTVDYYASLTAATLHKAGINLNFAPCVDVNVNPTCPVIGKLERSFSSDSQYVSQCAAHWIQQHSQHHVLSCLKHFPGHGSSDSDSHLGLVDVSTSWVWGELTPYRELISSRQADMIMTTHVFNSQIDSLWPATLSYNTLTRLLRNELKFQGVIITDDLAMGAMTRQYPFDTIIMRAILAGADLLCLSNNGRNYNPNVVPETVELIFSLVLSGVIPEERIHESAARIRKLKNSKL